MTYLTPNALKEQAPAAQKLPKSNDALIDTSAFLRRIAQDGYKPIFAAQGKAHADVDAPEKGRHFIVAADSHGRALAILNSHTVYRRAWLAEGYATPEAFLLGAVVPLPRWRGFEEPLTELGSYYPGLEAARDALTRWSPDKHQVRWLAKRFASTAYLPGHKPASAKALESDGGLTGLGYLRAMMAKVLAGGLEPALKKGILQRKVKPIKGPDALMQAGNAAFRTGLDAIRKYQLSDTALNFPAYKRT